MLQTVASLLGRLLLALVFILSGVSKLGNYTGTVHHMEAAGIPMAPFFLYAAVLVELGAGLMVLTGFRARLAALALVVFLIPTTMLFHFKPAFDANYNVIDKLQLIQVFKNLAIMGGLLLIFGNGAGKLTIGKDS